MQSHEKVIEVLHSTHPGVSRMESLARSYVWWPLMDREIERKVKDCPSCQQLLNGPVQAPLHPRELPECAWSHVHVDYAGPYEGLMFLVLVNTYSKWMEVVPICHATSQSMIEIIWIILPHVGCQKCVGIRQLHRLHPCRVSGVHVTKFHSPCSHFIVSPVLKWTS